MNKLDKLKSVCEKDIEKIYNQGLTDAWECVTKLFKLSFVEICNIFDCKNINDVLDLPIFEVMHRFQEYEKITDSKNFEFFDFINNFKSENKEDNDDGYMTPIDIAHLIAGDYDEKHKSDEKTVCDKLVEYKCICGYGWYGNIERHHYCPNCGRKVEIK